MRDKDEWQMGKKKKKKRETHRTGIKSEGMR